AKEELFQSFSRVLEGLLKPQRGTVHSCDVAWSGGPESRPVAHSSRGCRSRQRRNTRPCRPTNNFLVRYTLPLLTRAWSQLLNSEYACLHASQSPPHCSS